MKILLDMDGVLADFDAALFRDTAHFIDWPQVSLNREHRFCTDVLSSRNAKRVRRFIEETPFFRDLPVIPGAKEGVDAMLSAGWDVWVCSKPLEANATCASDKMEWIKRHFPELVGKVILAPKKSMVKGDILLDDAHKPADFHEASWLPVWYPYPHNMNGSPAFDRRLYWHWGFPISVLETLWEEQWIYYEEDE